MELWMGIGSITTAALVLSQIVTEGSSEEALNLRCVESEWQGNVQGHFNVHFDRREICRINHPWEVTQAPGDYGAITRTVTIPEGWKPPFWVRWYCSDNYAAEGLDQSAVGEGRTAVVMLGHRFKQVLIDNHVIWDRDVADPIFPGPKSHPLEPAGGKDPFPPYFRVNISDYVKPGVPFRLTLRVIDKVPSSEVLPGDFRREHRWYDKPQELEVRTFSTDVYWADVEVSNGPPPPIEGVEPSWRPPLRPLVRRPTPPPEEQQVPLALERADRLMEQPFPAIGGLPFPEGAVRQVRLALRDPDGNPVPVQGEPFAHWPDGSVKWVRLDALVPAPKSEGDWTLSFGSKVPPLAPEHPVQVQETQQVVRVDTGVLELVIRKQGDKLLDRVTLAGQREPISTDIASHITAALPVGGEDKTVHDRWVGLVARKQQVEVEANGPVRATVKVSGQVSAGQGTTLGRFVTRVDAFAGQPYLRILHRIFNDYPAPMVRIQHFDLQVPVAVEKPEEEEPAPSGAAQPGIYSSGRPPAGIFVTIGSEAGPTELSEVQEVSLVQGEMDHYAVFGMDANRPIEERDRAEGWIDYCGYRGGAAAFVRQFWQQYPKGLAVGGGGSLWVRFFAYCAQQQFYEPTQGEAKRHEVWLAFHPNQVPPEALSRFNRLVQRPPRLFSAEWVRTSGGLGLAPKEIKTQFPKVYEVHSGRGAFDPERVAHDCNTGYGLRHWGDRFNSNHWKRAGYGSAWSNNYYDGSIFKPLLTYLISGEPSQFERAEINGLHYMDVDICHFNAEHPEYVGGEYTLAFNHTGRLSGTGGRPSPNGLIVLGYLTADPDYLETIEMIGDRMVTLAHQEIATRGFRGCAPRCQAFPFAALMNAYEVIPKPEYLKAAKKFLDRHADLVDSRRGTQFGCGGPTYYTIGHSEGQVGWAAMRYYRATGDVDAAYRVLGLADSQICEPGGPATWEPWGHLESEAALYAYAYELTGDPLYLEHARESLQNGTWMPEDHLAAMYWIEQGSKRD